MRCATQVVCADLFGSDVIGTATGFMYLGVAIGLLVGPVMSGAMIDAGLSNPAVFGLSAGETACVTSIGLC